MFKTYKDFWGKFLFTLQWASLQRNALPCLYALRDAEISSHVLNRRDFVKKPRLNPLAHQNQCHDFLGLGSQKRLRAWGWQYWHCSTESTKPITVNSRVSLSLPEFSHFSALQSLFNLCWNLAVALSRNNLWLPLSSVSAVTAMQNTSPPPPERG